MKLCPRCKETKATTQFGKCVRAKDGLNWVCSCCNKQQSRDQRAKAKAAGTATKSSRARHIKHAYGLSMAQHDAMLAAQGGGCAICLSPLLVPQVDHCHASGAVRGLLCKPCNLALGLMRDNPEALERAASYVRRM